MVEYIGEHLWAGQLGHALAIVSLVGGLLGTLGFFLGTARHSGEWIRVGRIGFRLHSVAVLGIVPIITASSATVPAPASIPGAPLSGGRA